MDPKYIKSTYSELESMGFTSYEITYVFEGDESESLEIMAPWEDLGIIKKLYCKDYNLPADKVEIASEREITLHEFASLCGRSMDDTINYIAKDDPYYQTLSNAPDPNKTNDYGFKSSSPENPKISQLISFLYIGVAYLNDGILSDNEILKMVEKHMSNGINKGDAFALVEESMNWWDDAVKKNVELNEILQCTKHIRNDKSWDEGIKESLHMNLTLITTADGLVDLKSGEFIGERKLNVVKEIMKLLEV